MSQSAPRSSQDSQPHAEQPHAEQPATVGPQGQGWLRRLGPLLATHRTLLIAAVTAAVAAMAVQVAVPRVAGFAIDRAIADDTGAVWPLALTLVALGVGRGLTTFVYRWGLFSVSYKIECNLRKAIFNRLGRLPLSFFDTAASGEIISRANSDVRSVQRFLAFAPIMAVQITSFVAALVLMLSINVPLTLVSMAAAPAVYLLGLRLVSLTFPLSWIIESRHAQVAMTTEEAISGVRVVRAFAAEERQIARLARDAQRLAWANMLQHKIRAAYTPFIENLPRVALGLALFVGGHQVISGNLTVGDLVMFNLYILLLAAPFRFIGMMFIMGQRAKASALRVFEVLDLPDGPDAQDGPGSHTLALLNGAERTRGPAVTFADVTFGYGSTAVLSDFNLGVAPGEWVAVVGRTGCGKSTLGRLLLRFYEPGAGHVALDGVDIAAMPAQLVRRAVSLVPEEPFVFAASVRDNIAYGTDAATDTSIIDEQVVAAATAAAAHDFIVELDDGYDTMLGERGYDLSGGQRQRIAIARLLMARPSVVVLDDATSAIDVGVEERIHAALRNELAGATCIVIAHRLSTVALADRVVLMDGGQIVAQGTHAELMATNHDYVAALTANDEAAGEHAGESAREQTAGARW